MYLANVVSAPREIAASELAAVRGVFEVEAVLVVADAAAARGRRQGNLVVVARDEPFTRTQARAVDRAVRRLLLPARTWRADDPALA